MFRNLSNPEEFAVSHYDQELLRIFSSIRCGTRDTVHNKSYFDFNIAHLRPRLIGRRVQVVANPSLGTEFGPKTVLAIGNAAWALAAMDPSSEGLELDDITARSELKPGTEYPTSTISGCTKVQDAAGVILRVALFDTQVRALIQIPDNGISIRRDGGYGVATLVGHTGTDVIPETLVLTSIREA